MTQDTACLTKNCMRPAAAALKRGLCMVCYHKAKKLVTAGKATWEEFVRLGLALPDESDNAFESAFEQAKKENDAKGH